MKPLIILDRDGTLIKEPPDFQIDSYEKFQLTRGVVTGLKLLQNHGARFVIWTNQDGLGTRQYPKKIFEKIQKLLIDIFISEGIQFEKVLICPHTVKDCCDCRKPNPRLFLESGISYDPVQTIMIGDRKTDMEVAKKLGIKGIRLQADFYEAAVEAVQKMTQVRVLRKTQETSIRIRLSLDNRKKPQVSTGLKMLDHLITQLLFHAGLGGTVKARGDLWIDDHHLVEDLGISLGQALSGLLKQNKSSHRYSFVLPMDEARAECLIDVSGRFHFRFKAQFNYQKVGDLSTEMISHFFESLAQNLKANIHIEVLGKNDHHKAESIFKCVGKALSKNFNSVNTNFSSTKGALWI